MFYSWLARWLCLQRGGVPMHFTVFYWRHIHHMTSILMLTFLGSVCAMIHHKVTLLYAPYCFITVFFMNSLFYLNNIRPVSKIAEIKRCSDKSLKADKETYRLRLFCFGLNYFAGSSAMKNWQNFLHFEIKEEWLWLVAARQYICIEMAHTGWGGSYPHTSTNFREALLESILLWLQVQGQLPCIKWTALETKWSGVTQCA